MYRRDHTHEVDWLNGACTVFRREVIDRVGVYDAQNFFMYSEELDLCRRVKEAGWKIVYLPEAQVVHYVGKSSDQAVAARHIYFQTSKVHYFRKWHGAFQANLLRLFLLSQYVWQIGLESVKGLLGSKRELRKQRVKVVLASCADGPEMKIGLITGEYPPQQGGVGDFTRELARALIAAGHEAQVITTQPISHRPSAVSAEPEDGIVVQRVISSWGMRCWGEIAAVAKQERL